MPEKNPCMCPLSTASVACELSAPKSLLCVLTWHARARIGLENRTAYVSRVETAACTHRNFFQMKPHTATQPARQNPCRQKMRSQGPAFLFLHQRHRAYFCFMRGAAYTHRLGCLSVTCRHSRLRAPPTSFGTPGRPASGSSGPSARHHRVFLFPPTTFSGQA